MLKCWRNMVVDRLELAWAKACYANGIKIPFAFLSNGAGRLRE